MKANASLLTDVPNRFDEISVQKQTEPSCIQHKSVLKINIAYYNRIKSKSTILEMMFYKILFLMTSYNIDDNQQRRLKVFPALVTQITDH